jgi:hypothetical protein
MFDENRIGMFRGKQMDTRPKSNLLQEPKSQLKIRIWSTLIQKSVQISRQKDEQHCHEL